MAFQDQSLTCADCGKTFIFTAGEQQFHSERGFTNQPKRCQDCRSRRKAEQSHRGGGSERQGSSRTKGRTERPKFPAICTRCGSSFDAPFEPKPGRPVFCRDCFTASHSR